MTSIVYKAVDVFGVSRELPLTYTERKLVDGKLVDNLTRDKHVIIYGSSKQGKTCLRRHCLHDEDYILVQCQNNWDMAKLSEAILKQAGCEVEVSHSRTSDNKAKLAVKSSGGFKLFGAGLTAEGAAEGERGASATRQFEAIQLDPSDPNDLVRALKGIEFGKLIVLEDFHYLPQETQEAFAFALKTVHETSRITFIIVAVWREENRLIVYNGDLAGRVVSVDADEWSETDLRKVIARGEELLRIRFGEEFKAKLISSSFNAVYIVQECCYRACKQQGVHETKDHLLLMPDTLDAVEMVAEVIAEQGARYNSFLTNFAEGFQPTALEMFKWLLLPILNEPVEELEDGLIYREIRRAIQERHPAQPLNAGNITQALISVPALQAKKNIKPFVLDYDRNNLKLSVVDKGFLIWLQAQKREDLLSLVDLPSSSNAAAC